jgi:hypothetical protein
MARRRGIPGLRRTSRGFAWPALPGQFSSEFGSGGGSSGSDDAILAASVAAAGAGPFNDGQCLIIRVGAWPDRDYVELFRDNDASAWVQENPRALMSQSDINYMGVNTVGLSYIGGNSTDGGQTGAIGWTSKPIRRAAEFFAAGLKLQARPAAIMAGQAANAFTVRIRFFGHNDGETVVFSSDGSTAVAELAAIVTAADATIRFKDLPWQNVLKIGTSNPLAAADVAKANLWPRLYGSIPAGGYGREIDLGLEYRWVA